MADLSCGFWRWLALAMLSLAVGCSDNEIKRYRLSGSVTFNSKLVPAGNISFDPVSQKVGGGFVAISNGKFDTETFGRGHLGGKHHVLISGFDRLSNPNNPESPALPMFQPYELDVEFPEKFSSMDFEVPLSQAISTTKAKGARK